MLWSEFGMIVWDDIGAGAGCWIWHGGTICVVFGCNGKGLVVLVVLDLGVSGSSCICHHSREVGADMEPFVGAGYKGGRNFVG